MNYKGMDSVRMNTAVGLGKFVSNLIEQIASDPNLKDVSSSLIIDEIVMGIEQAQSFYIRAETMQHYLDVQRNK